MVNFIRKEWEKYERILDLYENHPVFFQSFPGILLLVAVISAGGEKKGVRLKVTDCKNLSKVKETLLSHIFPSRGSVHSGPADENGTGRRFLPAAG
ncbi:MAG: hypothetical protein BWY31_04508 [Lentisphaerae bacterium ADurb.Bin242]|nr:MAG: hypothetical protein BWY31_04508 [Lentisphaerae bacterium ADurb.Bin242]